MVRRRSTWMYPQGRDQAGEDGKRLKDGGVWARRHSAIPGKRRLEVVPEAMCNTAATGFPA